MVNWLDIRGKPMTGVFDVSSGDEISLIIGSVEVASYVADADGKFHITGVFVYKTDEDNLTDAQRAAMVKAIGAKLQEIAVGSPPQE